MAWLPYVLGAIAVLWVLMQMRPVLAGRRMRGKLAADFSLLLEAGQAGHARYLLYFYNEYCGPCRSMYPNIEALAARFPGQVLKVDVQQSSELARAFGVMVTPTSLLVNDGRIAQVLLGVKGVRRLERLLKG